MKTSKRRTRLLLLTALALVSLGILYTVTVQATFGPGEEWVCTEAAVQKEQAGYCSGSLVCRELCYFGDPTGFFQCFNN